jgi:hypothetical protein
MMPVAAPHAPFFAETVAIAPTDASLPRDAPRAGAHEREMGRIIESG